MRSTNWSIMSGGWSVVSVSKVQRSKSAVASVVYAVWGTVSAMNNGEVRASALSVVGPRGGSPMAWAMETRERVGDSAQRRNETINLIQSFSPEELDSSNPLDVERAHAAGLALASEVAPDCDVVVATHADTAHVHNHIIIANFDRGTGLAAPKGAGNAWRVKVANDGVMKSLDLEVLEQHEVSYSRDERLALDQGREIDGSGLDLSELTRETWREFARARIEELLEDDRVVDAIDIDGGNGVEPALDVMEDIAAEYHLSFSRRGRGKRKSQRSSFALIDAEGKELRVPGRDGTGASKAASAGSRLGADYTLDGLRARLHELHTKQLIEELEMNDYGDQYTTVEGGQYGTVGQAGVGYEDVERDGRGVEERAEWDARRSARAVAELSEATELLGQTNGDLAAFNRGDGGVRAGDGASDEFDEVDGGDRGRAAGGDSAPARGSTELGGGDRQAVGVDGRSADDSVGARRRAAESERRRRRAIERQRREALESDGARTGDYDAQPDF